MIVTVIRSIHHNVLEYCDCYQINTSQCTRIFDVLAIRKVPFHLFQRDTPQFCTFKNNQSRCQHTRLPRYGMHSLYYRPQTKFAKVMFLHLSVILFTGGCMPQCMMGYTHLVADTPSPPGADIPGNRHPPGADTPHRSRPPQGRHSSAQFRRYGQQAGGTHPTGMHTC